jgi:large subunit ribosomal protein L25
LVPIQLEKRKLDDLLKSTGSENSVFLLKLTGTGKSRHTMIREMQRDAVTGDLIHVDFLRVMLDEKVRVSVPIELRGESAGVKNEGGLLDFVTREVEVFCLPNNIPPYFELDVSDLHVGQHLEASQLDLPAEVELHVEPERVIASVAARRVGVVELEEEEEELLEKVAAEPEVVKRGKADEE